MFNTNVHALLFSVSRSLRSMGGMDVQATDFLASNLLSPQENSVLRLISNFREIEVKGKIEGKGKILQFLLLL